MVADAGRRLDAISSRIRSLPGGKGPDLTPLRELGVEWLDHVRVAVGRLLDGGGQLVVTLDDGEPSGGLYSEMVRATIAAAALDLTLATSGVTLAVVAASRSLQVGTESANVLDKEGFHANADRNVPAVSRRDVRRALS